MRREKPVQPSFSLVALSALLVVSACEQGASTRGASRNVEYPEGSAAAVQEGYRRAGEAQTRYEDCMVRYIPRYREQVAEYGEVFLGGGDSGVPVHPALEGCKTERFELQRLTDLAFGRSE